MKVLFALLVIASLLSVTLADGIFNSTLSVGEVAKGKLKTVTFNSVPLPAATFQLDAIQVFLINDTSKEQFQHGSLVVASVDVQVGGKKIIGFTASTLDNPLTFPSPYALAITGAVDVVVQLFVTNKTPYNVSLEYFLKWSSDANYTPLVRTATSAVQNYSSFNVPGTGNPAQFVIQNSVQWQQNINAMSFQASASQGIVSLQFVDTTSNTVVCKSTGNYKNNILVSMTPCTDVVALVKGNTYTTIATYDNSVARKGVYGNFALYVGYTPKPSTTSTSSTGKTTGPTSTGPSTSSTGKTSGPSSSGPSSSGPSSSTGKTSGPSSSGPHTSGPHTSGPHSSSAGGSSAGGSSSSGGTTTSGSSSNPTGSSSNPTGTSSDFTTAATSSNPTGTTTATGGVTVSPTGYASSGLASKVWESNTRAKKNIKFY